MAVRETIFSTPPKTIHRALYTTLCYHANESQKDRQPETRYCFRRYKGTSQASKRSETQKRERVARCKITSEDCERISSSRPDQSKYVSLELQQRLLDVFQDACTASLNDDLAGTIQEVKQHLFDRDFAGAFGKPSFLDAYAARWSPTRALTYLDILCSLPALSNQFSSNARVANLGLEHQKSLENLSTSSRSSADPTAISDASSKKQNAPQVIGTDRQQRIVCLGAGGGAELVSFAGYLHQYTCRPSSISLLQKTCHYQRRPAQRHLCTPSSSTLQTGLLYSQSFIQAPPYRPRTSSTIQLKRRK